MVHHTREDALDDREFERLIAATHQMDDYYALQARFVILVAGRLGLRAGEIAHMREEWVDWRDKMIEIPAHEPCDKGRGGGKCGYCRQMAEQMRDVSHEGYLEAYNAFAERHPHADAAELDEMVRGMADEEPRSFEGCLDEMWGPKTSASARDVPYDANTRASLVVEDFFEEFDEFPCSRTAINRRVTKAAEIADGLDPERVYPHCLRSSAAEHFSARGLDIVGLKQMFGWSDFSTAQCYLAGSGEATARKLRQLPG